MKYVEIQKQIVSLIAQVTQCEESGIDPRIALQEYGFDEFDMIEYVMKCEDAFGVVIEDDEIPNLQSVDDTVRYIMSKKETSL